MLRAICLASRLRPRSRSRRRLLRRPSRRRRARPGAKHTWAPADKHGFGTAHQLAGNAYFTLRQASLSEVYYPDLSTPGFRGLQFAVSRRQRVPRARDGRRRPAHIEPVAPGVTARVEPLAGALGFRQVTADARAGG